MKEVEILVIGGGPAGLCAAINAAQLGAKVMLVERDGALGGQLVKQTHMFFGSEQQHAAMRGVDIGRLLVDKIRTFDRVEVMADTSVIGLYEDGVVTLEQDGRYRKVKPQAIIAATGASEKYLGFPNNDLPGIYGAGAVQTLMNVYGVKPGNNVLMVGAGNIGLIVSYQLLQAGVNVVAIVEAAERIGGYLVHASKIRRMGVPIYTRHTVKEAHGQDSLTGATIVRLDEQWQPVPGTEQELEVDVICISVGLSPLSELLWQAGCAMKYVSGLGGYVPVRDESMQTSRPGLFVAGDVAGIEEASSAMVEGYLAGLGAAEWVGYTSDTMNEAKKDLKEQLRSLRSGPEGVRIRGGLAQVTRRDPGEPAAPATKSPAAIRPGHEQSDHLAKTGVAAPEDIRKVFPSDERLARGPAVIVECFREIPCNPCHTACHQGAIKAFADINALPEVDHDLCSGCGLCISQCPGLSIRSLDMTWSEQEALVRIPYEFLPLPSPGEGVEGMDREGRVITEARVEGVQNTKQMDRTPVVSLAVKKEWAKELVFMRRKQDKKVSSEDSTIVCRCSDVTLGEIRQIIKAGHTTVDEIKRLTRAGMGPCQGKTCGQMILREISLITGKPPEELSPGTYRPLVKAVKLGEIAEAAGGGEEE